MPRYIRVYEEAIPSSFCDELIAAFESDALVKSDPQPEYTTRRYLFLSDKLAWSRSSMELARLTAPLVDNYFDRPAHMAETRPAMWLDDGYVMACYDEGAVCSLHADGQNAEPPFNGHRIATVLFYLSDVGEGGETHFPLQEVKVKPKKGRAVIFPPGYHHPHEVLPANSARYIAQTWITDAEMVVNSR